MRRGVRRLADGIIRVELPAAEQDLLRSLPDQLRPILSGEQDAGAATRRLFPPAYDDPEAESDYREMMDAELAEERIGKIDAFAETLDGGQRELGRWQVDLDSDEAEAWLSATNDARLVLGIVVGITSEEQWEDILASGEPAAAALAYLGWLQEELLAALTQADEAD